MKQSKSKIDKGLALRKLAQEISTKGKQGIERNQLITFKTLKTLFRDESLFSQIKNNRWLQILKIRSDNKYDVLLKETKEKLNLSIDATLIEIQKTIISSQYWIESKKDQSLKTWNYNGRIYNREKLIRSLKNRSSDKIFFFHHYDKDGYFPRSWLSSLEELQQEGWCVIVSSSLLSKQAEEELDERNIFISKRENIGLCIGAYKDFTLFFSENKPILRSLKKIIFCNDSSLPIGGSNKFYTSVNEVSSKLDQNDPVMIGMTDSVQCGCYHIQSYFLAINSKLFYSDIWSNFWSSLSLKGNKDQLIKSGEIGLSKVLTEYGINTFAKYPITELLISQENIEHEVGSLGVNMLSLINPTIHAWRSLLNSGYPLIKKQLIFDIPQQPIPLSQLKSWINHKDYELRKDIERLIKSRFTSIVDETNMQKVSLISRIKNRLKRVMLIAIQGHL